MTSEQRDAWNAEFGIPEFPYLFYLQEGELSDDIFEKYKGFHRDKINFCNEIFEKLLYEHFIGDKK